MPQLGNLALAIALILAVYSIVANIYGARRNAPDFVVSARHAIWSMCAMVTIAVVVLWEAFSTKIMEYMAEGVPVIVSKTKVDRYYFNDSIVRFFDSGDESGLAAAMLELMDNRQLRARFALNAREYVAQNSWDVKKHEYLHLVDSLICAPGARPVPVPQNSSL